MSLPRPFYEDSAVTIYHGDCREILPHVQADVLVTDPPYGIAYKPAGGEGALYARNKMAPVIGDSIPFDPRWLLGWDRLVLFGANHFAHLLPPSATWFVWDKREGYKEDWFADCEMAWSNTGGPARLFRHYWMGGITASERYSKLHPTQKPVALMRWVINRVTKPGETIADPYCGSGPILVAAKDLGRKAIGIEIEERYCEIAARRCAQEVLL
jgi:DNA modification methylase